MKIKLIKIKGCKTCDEVLVYLDQYGISGKYVVRILAWHKTKDGDFIQKGEVDYCNSTDDKAMNERLIADFSEFSANVFANSMTF